MSKFQLAVQLDKLPEELNLNKDQLDILNVALDQITTMAYNRSTQCDCSLQLKQDSISGKVELQMAVKVG